MTLEQLRIFVAVAEHEHMTRAAEALRLTQSATSAAIAALEARHGTRLFDRVGRGIALTAAGRAFLPAARAVLAEAAGAEALLADLTGLARGRLSVAASQTVAHYWLPPLLLHYRESYPGIVVDVAIANTEAVAALLHDGAADIGFVEGRVADDALSARPIAADDMVLVAAAGFDAGPPPLDPRRLRWILREKGSGTRDALERALAAHGLGLFDLDVLLELPSNEAVRTAVEAGGGVAVLSRVVVASGLETGRLAVLPFAMPGRQFLMLTHRQRSLSRAAEALAGLVDAQAP
ncbi:LysR family transcriptional regulator [Zavarzinia compransoris]|uniref:LysR family transcriptional regulator n=1 Tax=Zavarzinia marina TaxID=2911065 RepID=UPI001F18636D|nr:LysR family transcriptional regulator [Zavarzinia marina]MCF4165269.1 LysR family transcriptional regulator [Zavarzinia marina]